MPVHLEAVSYDAHDPLRLAGFWAGLLGREVVTEPGGALVPGDASQVGLRFVAATSERTGPGRLHLHLTSQTPAQQQQTVATVLRLGGRHLDVGQGPEASFVVMADPEGNELCVIEAGNRFLAGCGLLGEVTCDGTREVGLFWHDVLGWPLVWDQDGETAIQAPAGGTKLSWGGPPVAEKTGRNRQRFDLVADDVGAEVERLLSLRASRLGDDLVDPDGNELGLRG